MIFPLSDIKPLTQLQHNVRDYVDETIYNKEDEADESLKVPDEQEFAINNIQMNMTKKEVENKYGSPKRVTSNEYGTKWYTYYLGDYNQFMMVAYIDNKVHAMYSNQSVISSKSKIKYHSPRNVVEDRLGKPISEMQKGRYRIEIDNDEYDIFHKDHIYTTVFYDKHSNNSVTALLQVSDKMEKRLPGQYGAPSKNLARSFELQNVDLLNAERKQHNLNTLNYSSEISKTARKHSTDMAEKHYFDHNNLDGQSPFDRLKEDDIEFAAGGENLAYGQKSSNFAHEGLMNSLGHRKNILKKEFNTIGVGVDFNDEKQPYWTENYTD